jgi:rRNA maturation endonuclease Nob1
MGLGETKYVVLSQDGFTKPATERWRDTLRRWLVQCPNCAEVRLVVGARENERYVCKDCGHSFTIRALREESTRELGPGQYHLR